MITCILLSAGKSSRFGSPKALATIRNSCVIKKILSTLISSNIEEIIVVLGHHYKEIKPFVLNHKKVKVVYNKSYYLGQTSSFKTGIKSASKDTSGVMLYPIDYINIKKKTINNLCDKFKKTCPTIMVPRFNNINGHPPIFNIQLFNEIVALSSKKGLNQIIHKYFKNCDFIDINDPGIIQSFNTKEELLALTKKSRLTNLQKLTGKKIQII